MGAASELDSFELLRTLGVLAQDDVAKRGLPILLALEGRPYPGTTAIEALSAAATLLPHSSKLGRLAAQIIAAWVSSSEEAEGEFRSRVSARPGPEVARLLMASFEFISTPRQRSLASFLGHAARELETGASDCLAIAAGKVDAEAQKLLVDAVLQGVVDVEPDVVRRATLFVANAGCTEHADWILKAFRLADEDLLGDHSGFVRQLCVQYWGRCPDERALERLLGKSESRYQLHLCLPALLSLQEDRTDVICDAVRRDGANLHALLLGAAESTAQVDIEALLRALGSKLEFDPPISSLLKIARKGEGRSVEALVNLVKESRGAMKATAVRLLADLGVGPQEMSELVGGNPVIVVHDFLARNAPSRKLRDRQIGQMLDATVPNEMKVRVSAAQDEMELTVWAVLEGCNLHVVPADHFGYAGVDFVCISRDPLALVFVGVTGGAVKDDVRNLIETAQRLRKNAPDALQSAKWLSVIFSGGSAAGIAPECIDHARREGVALLSKEEIRELVRFSAAGVDARELLAAIGEHALRGSSLHDGTTRVWGAW